MLARDGYEVVLIEFVPRQRILRLYVDHTGGVSLDDCVRISHLVGDVLDGEGISERIPGPYHLEVSSPGLDRPLVRPRDFQRFVGRRVQVTTRDLVTGRKRFQGVLAAADEHQIRIDMEGESFVIAYDVIVRAKLVPEL